LCWANVAAPRPKDHAAQGSQRRIAMIAGIIIVVALMMLATQLMGQAATGAWPSITLSSEFGIPADRVFSNWFILDRPLQFILGDVQLWVVMIFAAALIYWLTDWTSEMLGRIFRRAPPPAATSVKSP
ncbi:MAG TPA: hypothetical protein VIY51_14425, partial [Xanthobacteraceae bacterium]